MSLRDCRGRRSSQRGLERDEPGPMRAPGSWGRRSRAAFTTSAWSTRRAIRRLCARPPRWRWRRPGAVRRSPRSRRDRRRTPRAHQLLLHAVGALLRQLEAGVGVAGVVGVAADLDVHARVGLEDRGGQVRELLVRAGASVQRVECRRPGGRTRTTLVVVPGALVAQEPQQLGLDAVLAKRSSRLTSATWTALTSRSASASAGSRGRRGGVGRGGRSRS